jgi:hypothetical protein
MLKLRRNHAKKCAFRNRSWRFNALIPCSYKYKYLLDLVCSRPFGCPSGPILADFFSQGRQLLLWTLFWSTALRLVSLQGGRHLFSFSWTTHMLIVPSPQHSVNSSTTG